MVEDIDGTIDLTIEALFARDSNIQLVLNHHRTALNQKYDFDDSSFFTANERHKLFRSKNPFMVAMLSSMQASIATINSLHDDKDYHEMATMLSRIFNDHELSNEVDPYRVVMVGGNGCDVCGTIIDALNRTKSAIGLCKSCDDFYYKEKSEWDMLTVAKTVKIGQLDIL